MKYSKSKWTFPMLLVYCFTVTYVSCSPHDPDTAVRTVPFVMAALLRLYLLMQR